MLVFSLILSFFKCSFASVLLFVRLVFLIIFVDLFFFFFLSTFAYVIPSNSSRFQLTRVCVWLFPLSCHTCQFCNSYILVIFWGRHSAVGAAFFQSAVRAAPTTLLPSIFYRLIATIVFCSAVRFPIHGPAILDALVALSSARIRSSCAHINSLHYPCKYFSLHVNDTCLFLSLSLPLDFKTIIRSFIFWQNLPISEFFNYNLAFHILFALLSKFRQSLSWLFNLHDRKSLSSFALSLSFSSRSRQFSFHFALISPRTRFAN